MGPVQVIVGKKKRCPVQDATKQHKRNIQKHSRKTQNKNRKASGKKRRHCFSHRHGDVNNVTLKTDVNPVCNYDLIKS